MDYNAFSIDTRDLPISINYVTRPGVSETGVLFNFD